MTLSSIAQQIPFFFSTQMLSGHEFQQKLSPIVCSVSTITTTTCMNNRCGQGMSNRVHDLRYSTCSEKSTMCRIHGWDVDTHETPFLNVPILKTETSRTPKALSYYLFLFIFWWRIIHSYFKKKKKNQGPPGIMIDLLMIYSDSALPYLTGHILRWIRSNSKPSKNPNRSKNASGNCQLSLCNGGP